ncbi:MAG: rhodanese-like domain-containing protein [Sulfolobaceae archaeon]|jgi:rhodanese-related sulfurtransferase
MQRTDRRTPYYPNIQSVPPSVVRKLIRLNSITVIDIRQPWEYEEHHIPGALLIPLDYFDKLFPLLNTNPIVLVCEHANRSTWLIYNKPYLFKGVKVYNMLGGMELWIRMGYEISKGMDENGMIWYKLLKNETKLSFASNESLKK